MLVPNMEKFTDNFGVGTLVSIKSNHDIMIRGLVVVEADFNDKWINDTEFPQ